MKFGELLSCSHPLIRFGLCQGWRLGCVLWLTTCHCPPFGGYQKWLCAKVDDLPLSIVLATTESGSGAAPTECKRLYVMVILNRLLVEEVSVVFSWIASNIARRFLSPWIRSVFWWKPFKDHRFNYCFCIWSLIYFVPTVFGAWFDFLPFLILLLYHYDRQWTI